MHPPWHPADAGTPPAPVHRHSGGPGPPKLPQLRRHQAPPHGGAPHEPALGARQLPAEPARMADAPATRNPSAEPARMATAPVAEKPWAERANGTVGAPCPAKARDELVRGWDAVTDLRGGETLPMVLEVYGWLNWASSGHKRNRPFDAMLLRRDGGNHGVPPEGWVMQEDH